MFTKISEKITEKYFRFKTENLLQNTLFFELLNIVRDNKERVTISDPDCNVDTIFFNEEKDTKFTLYYDLIRVYIEGSTNKIIKVSVLKPGCQWEFDSKKNDISNTFDVYTWYDIENLVGDRCMGEKYLQGNWNEYVYNIVKRLSDQVNSWTRYNIFNDAFKNECNK